MEALLLLLDGMAFVVLVFLGLRDDRRPPGTPQSSPFRATEDTALRPREAAEQALRQRIARSRV